MRKIRIILQIYLEGTWSCKSGTLENWEMKAENSEGIALKIFVRCALSLHSFLVFKYTY